MRTEAGKRNKKFSLPKANLYLKIYEIVGMCISPERDEKINLNEASVEEKFVKFDVGKGRGVGVEVEAGLGVEPEENDIKVRAKS